MTDAEKRAIIREYLHAQLSELEAREPPTPPTSPTPPTPPDPRPVPLPPSLPPSSGVLLYEQTGDFVPTPAQEIFEGVIPRPAGLTEFSKITVDLDFTVGPWFPAKPDGPHALLWLFIRNHDDAWVTANVHGPRKNKVRNQITHGAGGTGTVRDAPCRPPLEIGETYHFRYVYDGSRADISVVDTAGRSVCSYQMAGPASAPLLIPKEGARFVLGHRSGQHYEVPSHGWTYSNLRVVGE